MITKLQLIEKHITKYKYAILILFIGIIMMTFTSSESQSTEQTETTINQTEYFNLSEFQQELQETLSYIDGIGRVKLSLSLNSTEEYVYAEDIRQSNQSEITTSYESSLSIVSDSGYGQNPILIKNLLPTFRGAVILCDGAENENVSLSVVQAVSSVCDLNSDKISVIKMRE